MLSITSAESKDNKYRTYCTYMGGKLISFTTTWKQV